MRVLVVMLTILLLPSMAAASATRPAELGSYGADLAHVGSGSIGFLFWRLFDAELWAAGGRFHWDERMVLSLTYRTSFSAEELTESTIAEMRRIYGWPAERLARFRAEVAPCMADVAAGDRFTAASPEPDRVVLYLNGGRRCELVLPGLRRAYLGIWLSEASRFPDQSRRLIGEPAW